MTGRFSTIPVATLLLCMLPAIAMAHTGAGDTHGFAHGLGHPVSGLDHIAAMVLVGILGWQIGGAARWLLPATFVLSMAAGGAYGVLGFSLPLVEIGIALSVVVLGLMITLSWKASIASIMAIVGAGGVFHGYAHGLEMPETAGGLAYGIGFLSATALLHLAGLTMGLLLGKLGQRGGSSAVRIVGGAGALLGLGILSGAV